MTNDSTQYIARISYGKDSLKMLDVIKSRGLPLDRITTTDVWATDTISANLPPVEQFKARMDQRIWDMYRIEVEHLCALNPDGTKRTYEQMFYHVPKRKNSQSVQVERERERDGLRPGSILGFPDLWNPWCQASLKRSAYAPSPRKYYRIPTEYPVQLVPEAQNSVGGDKRLSFGDRCDLVPEVEDQSQRIQGYPAQISPWCRKLKIDKVKTPFLLSAK